MPGLDLVAVVTVKDGKHRSQPDISRSSQIESNGVAQCLDLHQRCAGMTTEQMASQAIYVLKVFINPNKIETTQSQNLNNRRLFVSCPACFHGRHRFRRRDLQPSAPASAPSRILAISLPASSNDSLLHNPSGFPERV